jgi:cytochrome b
MKKLLYTVCLLLLAAVSPVFASANTDLFATSETQIDEVFAPLDQLAEIVETNADADLNFVQVHFSTVASSVSLMNELMSASRPMEDRPVAGISGYIWGACLGIAGVAIVYFLLDDASQAYRKKETTHAVVGCVIATAVWTVLYFTVLATAWGWGV